MSDEPHICPICKSKVEEDYDDYRSSNSNGCWYDIWCPNCGAKTIWYSKWKWPDRFDWQVSKIALDKYPIE